MSQLSIYIDSETHKKLEKAAKAKKVSVSKYIREALHKSFTDEWPADFFNLCGSISDDSFVRPEQGSFNDDSHREAM